YTPWGGPPATRSLSVGPDGVVYANVHVGGILRSADEGRSWEPTIDIDADVHQVLADPSEPGRVFAAAAVGLAVTDDGGASWRYETDGLDASYARAVAIADGLVLVSVSRGPGGQRSALYRCPLGGGPFERCTDGLPEWFASNVDTACLAAEGPVVVFGTDEGSVFLSEDGGATWRVLADGLPAVRSVGVA
ncbi:MAG: WD40/YVTN/BNR-like repeat-containing protein, partial [Actinomycetota bacterium]